MFIDARMIYAFIFFLHTAFADSSFCSIEASALVNESSQFYIRGDLVNLRNGPSTKDKILKFVWEPRSMLSDVKRRKPLVEKQVLA